jgi:hypothetical protein
MLFSRGAQGLEGKWKVSCHNAGIVFLMKGNSLQ